MLETGGQRVRVQSLEPDYLALIRGSATYWMGDLGHVT